MTDRGAGEAAAVTNTTVVELKCSICGGDKDNKPRWRRVTAGTVEEMRALTMKADIQKQLASRDFRRAPAAVGELLCMRSVVCTVYL